jgi:hypothetical protein
MGDTAKSWSGRSIGGTSVRGWDHWVNTVLTLNDPGVVLRHIESMSARLRQKAATRVVTPHSNSCNSLSEAHGEKLEGSMATPTTRAAIEPSGFSPCVSERELQELE